MGTFVLGGIWHGAGWTFILWGAIHGIALVIARGFATLHIKLPRTLNWAMTFLTVHIGWIFFRSEDLSQAMQVLKALFGVGVPDGPSHIVISESDKAALYLLAAFLIVLVMPNTSEFTRDIRQRRKVVFAAVLFRIACSTMLAYSSEVFLYFNF